MKYKSINVSHSKLYIKKQHKNINV